MKELTKTFQSHLCEVRRHEYSNYPDLQSANMVSNEKSKVQDQGLPKIDGTKHIRCKQDRESGTLKDTYSRYWEKESLNGTGLGKSVACGHWAHTATWWMPENSQ